MTLAQNLKFAYADSSLFNLNLQKRHHQGMIFQLLFNHIGRKYQKIQKIFLDLPKKIISHSVPSLILFSRSYPCYNFATLWYVCFSTNSIEIFSETFKTVL